MSDIHYANPKLTDVVARIDYTHPIKQIATGLSKDLQKALYGRFPILEPLEEEPLTTDPGASWVRVREYRYFSKNKQKRFILSPQHAFLEYKKYDSYETLKSDFLGILGPLFASCPELMVRRFGLRYVNQFDMEGEGDVTDWNSYIKPSCLGFMSAIPDDTKLFLTKAIQNVSWAYDDYNMNCNFGLHNPDFPATLRRKIFVLDLDAYVQGALELDDIKEKLDVFHQKIQELFEDSITEELRKVISV
ncbi:MAG: TIGR04255 family protein [Candidatus Zixiibacteriota bacterium]